MIGMQKITRIMISPFNISIAYDNLHEFALLMALIFKLGIKQLPTATYLQESINLQSMKQVLPHLHLNINKLLSDLMMTSHKHLPKHSSHTSL